MRTLFLGSYGFGNLGDELCLIDALRAFPTSDAWAFSANADYTRRCTGVQNFISERDGIFDIKPERIVLGGGGVGFWPSLRDSLHWMWSSRGVRNSAEMHIYNIGVAKITEPSWWTDNNVRLVFANLNSFTVRDHVSQWLTREWGFAPLPGLTLYPERDLPADDSLATLLPPGPLLGVSITGQRVMAEALIANQARVRRMLAPFKGYKVVPIISVNHPWHKDEDDVAGFRRFAELFLEDFEIALPETLDVDWWNANLTPLSLKGLIKRCDMLISQRKHNIIHAIGDRVPFIALHPSADDSLQRIMLSLQPYIDPVCGFLSLP